VKQFSDIRNEYPLAFDILSRTQVTDGSLNGNPVSETGVGSSVDFEYVYHSAGNLRFLRDPKQKGANRYEEHTYNNNSTINQAQYHQPSSPHTYKRYRYEHTYDNRNQLKSANYKHYFSAIATWQDPVDYDVTNIRYDRDGNLKSLERQMNGNYVDFEYSHAYGTESNRMEWVVEWNNQESIDLTHDRNGNTFPTSGVMTSISGDYDITGASYDWRNLPLVIIKYGPYSYKYDHLGNRTYKSSGTTRYLRGAFGETLAVYSGSTLQYRNILRPDGTVIGRREQLTLLLKCESIADHRKAKKQENVSFSHGRGLTKLSEGSLEKLWENRESEHWDEFFKKKDMHKQGDIIIVLYPFASKDNEHLLYT